MTRSTLLLSFALVALTFAALADAFSTTSSKTSSTIITSPPMSSVHCQGLTKKRLANSVVLLTGATGGLGKALVYQLVDCNVKQLIISGRTQNQLDQLVQECRQINSNVKVDTIICDLSSPLDVDKAAETVVKMTNDDPVDLLINNGGVSSRSSFLETKHDIDRLVMQINFFSGAALAKALVPPMIKSQKQGRIIWISSVQGLVGIPERTSYAASKFAVQGYTESLRAELAMHDISVHTVSPGYIRTNLSKNAYKGDGTAHGKVDATTAAGADPEAVAVELLDLCIAKNKVDFTIASTFSATAAIYLRLLCPGLLRSKLVKRFEKSQKDKVD